MMMKLKVVKFDPFFSHLNQQTRKVLQQKIKSLNGYFGFYMCYIM
ncbi:hypothetical protein HanXRQr2_Chr13g0613331 [Helianthus annuus]|uniref:Uncharacterized protein n=1 Tax=Helianthus annuus TaxID=4232 RepID=A0A9K3EKY0_HELAN|nr:hypothetical protein HanXRQr2_Chr13g0613331 [Helianthus annuus]